MSIHNLTLQSLTKQSVNSISKPEPAISLYYSVNTRPKQIVSASERKKAMKKLLVMANEYFGMKLILDEKNEAYKQLKPQSKEDKEKMIKEMEDLRKYAKDFDTFKDNNQSIVIELLDKLRGNFKNLAKKNYDEYKIIKLFADEYKRVIIPDYKPVPSCCSKFVNFLKELITVICREIAVL